MTEIKRGKRNVKAEEEYLQAVSEYNVLLAEYFPLKRVDPDVPIIMGEIHLKDVFEEFEKAEAKIKEKREKWKRILGIWSDLFKSSKLAIEWKIVFVILNTYLEIWHNPSTKHKEGKTNWTLKWWRTKMSSADYTSYTLGDKKSQKLHKTLLEQDDIGVRDLMKLVQPKFWPFF